MKESACSQETQFYQWEAWDVKNVNDFKTSLDILNGKVHWDILNTKTEIQHPAQEGQVFRPGRLCQKQRHSVLTLLLPSLPRLLLSTTVGDTCAYIAPERKVWASLIDLRGTYNNSKTLKQKRWIIIFFEISSGFPLVMTTICCSYHF